MQRKSYKIQREPHGCIAASRGLWAGAAFCAFVLSAVFDVGGTAHALDANRLITQYAHTAWRMQDGTFAGAPSAIAQTTDGYLWIGTNAGLLRFDGVRFVPFSPPSGERLLSPEVTSLLAARDGSLWIGTSTALEHWSQGRLTAYTNVLGLVRAIVEDRDGAIWISRTRVPDDKGPLCRISPGQEHCYGKADGIPFRFSTTLLQGDDTDFWVASVAALTRWSPTAHRTYAPETAELSQAVTGIEALAAARDGSLWVGFVRAGPGLGLQRLVNDSWQTLELPGFSSADLPVSALLLDRENALWVGTTDRGIYRVRAGSVDHYSSADGLSSDGVTALFQDHEGSIWVATQRGLDKFRDMRVASYSRREGLSNDNVGAVVASLDGTVWIGNMGSLDGLRAGRVHSMRAESGLPGTQVTSQFEDRDGRLWVGVDQKVAVLQQGRFRLINGSRGKALGTITGITQDSVGDIWLLAVGDPMKLVRIRNLQIQQEIAPPDIPATRRIVADTREGLWLGLMNGDLAHYVNGRLQIIPFHRARHVASIHEMITTPDGSVLAATSSGVIGSRNGMPYTLGTSNGLPCDRISSLIFDRRGALWLYATCGLISIPADEIERWWASADARVRFRVFDAADGVQHAISPFQPTAARSPDGRLWFANTSVLQTIDPEHLGENAIAPPVHIEAVVADRQLYAPIDGVRFPPRTRDIQIDYTALSFVIPEKVLFRYRLEGHDEAWQEPGPRRQAFYSDLRPGSYRFQVIARNNDGVWNDVGASFTFVIPPTFYQTAWFAALCIAAAIASIWLLFVFRLRQIKARMRTRMEERLAERERIARELHDTFLQSVQGLMLRFQSAMEKIPPSEPARLLMEQTLDRADAALAEGRDRVSALRGPMRAEANLPQALEALAKELAHDGQVEFRITIEGTPRSLHPLVADEIERLASEALTNAYRHAHARQIDVELIYTRKALTVRVTDDGCGFEQAAVKQTLKPGHWGLIGMQERARKIHARLNISSSPNAGTAVELTVPASMAFQRETQPRRRNVSIFEND